MATYLVPSGASNAYSVQTPGTVITSSKAVKSETSLPVVEYNTRIFSGAVPTNEEAIKENSPLPAGIINQSLLTPPGPARAVKYLRPETELNASSEATAGVVENGLKTIYDIATPALGQLKFV